MFNPPVSSQQFNALQQAAYHLAACTDQLFQQIEQEQVLASIIDRIRSSLELGTIFKTTSTAIRQLLNADRVGVFCFTPDSGWDEGEFVAEDVALGFSSALEAKVYDHCFGSQFAVYYTQGRVQAVSDIYNADLSDCHIQILERFQVRANLIVPVLKGEKLWGLLCIHQCSNPRRWQLSEIEFVRKIATHFAIALQQAEHLEQLKHQASLLVEASAQEKALLRQKALVKITNRIRQSLQWEVICQTATEEVRQLLEVDRVTIYRFNPDWSGDFLFESVVDGWQPLVGVSSTIKDTYLMETQGGRYAANETFAVSDIYTAGHSDCHVVLLEKFQARAYASVPIFEGERLWGLLTAFQNAAPRSWQADEIQLLTQIGEQLGIALQQAESVRQIQAQSVELKQMLEELQQSQLQLIQQEKMAALGQLIAGVAHEINNPLGAIQASASNTHKALQNALIDLPYLYERLNLEEQQIFFALIGRATRSHQVISTLEGRAIKRRITIYLQDYEIEAARNIADLLMDMGIHEELGFLLPLLKGNCGEWAIQLAYNLTCSFTNNQTILRAVDRSAKIVFALKNYARFDQTGKKQLVKIVDGLETVLQIYHNQLKRDIQVIRDYQDIPTIWGYSDELIQIWTNLIHNAIQAMESGGRLTISTQTQDNEVEVSITDTGVGIPSDLQQKIFDAFFTTKPAGKGSGLGLHICRKIIDKHQGRIQVASQPGHTQFRVWLPIESV